MATVCKQHAQWNIIIYGQQPLSQSAAHNITRSEAAAAFLSSQEAKSEEFPEFQKNCKNNRFGYRKAEAQLADQTFYTWVMYSDWSTLRQR